jgi:signal peptidase I
MRQACPYRQMKRESFRHCEEESLTTKQSRSGIPMHRLQAFYHHRIIRFIRSVITTALGTMCVIFMLAIFLPHLSIGNQFSSYIITSGSMAPTIPAGSVVVTRRQPTYSPGDVIAFFSPNEPGVTVVHRLVQQTTNGFTTKGDNNNALDQWTVLGTSVRGSVFLYLPYVGYLAVWVRQPIGFAVIVGTPMFFLIFQCLLLIFDGIGDVKKKKNKKGNELCVFLACVLSISLFAAIDRIQLAVSSFHSQATLSGISITVKNLHPSPTLTPTPTPHPEDDHDHDHDHDDDDDHRCHGKPFYVHGYHGHQAGHFRFVFSGKKRVRFIEYDIEYDSDQGRQGIHRHQFFPDEWDVTPPDVITGTCSTNGFCVSHTNVKHIHSRGTVTFEDGSKEAFDQDVDIE